MVSEIFKVKKSYRRENQNLFQSFIDRATKIQKLIARTYIGTETKKYLLKFKPNFVLNKEHLTKLRLSK